MPVYEGPLSSGRVDRLPLVWTGSEFATAFFLRPDDETPSFIFSRFSEAGEHIGGDWSYPAPTGHLGLDLVWTGSEFGLFYSDIAVGIFYMLLNADGKPLGSPVLVEPDPQARATAADRTADGFILAWMTEGSQLLKNV